MISDAGLSSSSGSINTWDINIQFSEKAQDGLYLTIAPYLIIWWSHAQYPHALIPTRQDGQKIGRILGGK